jgi:hypothetical protein
MLSPPRRSIPILSNEAVSLVKPLSYPNRQPA